VPASTVTEIINNSGGGTATIDLSNVQSATETIIPAAALSSIANAGLDVELKLPQGTITLDADALASAVEQAGGENISVGLSALGVSDLNSEQRSAVKDNDVVFSITVSSGEQAIRSFDGTLTVTVPYTGPLPAAVWYLNAEGELEKLDSVYDPVTRTVTFKTNHLSLYVVGFDADAPTPFIDVPSSAWYFNDVKYVYENGLMTGTGANQFSPNATLTRGMVVTVLWRLRGEPMLADYQNPFSDVDWQAYYFNAVQWASASKIVSGYNDVQFGPNDPITRQDFAVILMRYMDHMKVYPITNAQWLYFADGDDIASYAMDAIQTFNKLGIINGVGEDEDGLAIISPRGNATRAQAAAMLHRFVLAME